MLWMIIIGAVLIAVTWPVVAVLKASFWIAAVVTAAVILIVATVIVVRFVRARMRAAALERELLRQAEKQANRVAADRRPQILALKAQMKTALDALKQSKLAGGGRSALYALPWYVVIGPPAAGKTTALSKSGLGFITPAGASGSKMRGTAGTRNCDWWFSRNAILLDTAGRLTTEEDDREEWMTFLDTLRRFRPSRPLDGILVALSTEDLLKQSEEQLHELVGLIRARTDELMNRLEMVLPIYVLFTKVDLVGGFVEFFGDLTKPQRAQAWGASFSVDDDRLEDPAELVAAEFETLLGVLHARMIERLAREPQPEVRARVLQFPIEFGQLKEPVARFIDDLSQANPYAETPFVRGFFFSSGTQTGRSIDRVVGNMARGFNLGAIATPEGKQTEPQSYFVTELFSKVVFPDRHLAARSLSRLKRAARNRLLWGGAAVLGALVLITPAALSYVANMQLIHATERDVREARALERTGQAIDAANALDLLLERNDQLEQKRGEVSLPGLIGPYSAGRLQDSLERLYLKRLRAMVQDRVRPELVADLRAIGDIPRWDQPIFQSSYEDLKLYVMLTQPAHLQPEEAARRLAHVWARALNSQSSTDEERLAAHAKHYIKAFRADTSWAWKADKTVLTTAQGHLTAPDLEKIHLELLVEATQGAPPVRFREIFDGAATPYWSTRGPPEVPGLYTALGWEKVRALLEPPSPQLEFEPWVVGTGASQGGDSKKVHAQKLQELYFKEYAGHWSNFLKGLEVASPKGLQDAISELRALTGRDGPYVRLFRTVAKNVRLDIGPTSLAGKALAAAKDGLAAGVAKVAGAADAGDAGVPERPISSVEQQFEPVLRFVGDPGGASKADAARSGLEEYLRELTSLESVLEVMSRAPEVSSEQYTAELSKTEMAVRRQIEGTDTEMRLILDQLLVSPIRANPDTPLPEDLAKLTADWRGEVWENYRTNIKPRYPFTNSAAELSLPDFVKFFAPESGVFWKFFKKNIEARVKVVGTKVVRKDLTPFRDEFLSCVNVAQEITEAVFGNAQAPAVEFDVMMHSVSPKISEVDLVVDGKTMAYKNGREGWVAARWPGKGDQHGATLAVKGEEGFADERPRMGDFGLFRLLQDGGLQATGAMSAGVPVLAASWQLSGDSEHPVRIEFKPKKGIHPFSSNFFTRFDCPSEVTLGASTGQQ